MATRLHKMLVLGGTGPTGQHVVRQALEVGHTVTVVARHPERLTERHVNLTRVSLDLTTDSDGLARALDGHDLVLSCIGRGLSLRSGNLIRRSAPLIVAAMERAGPSRLVFVSSFGVAETFSQAPWQFRLVFRTLLSGLYADKAAAEVPIRGSSLDWTLLYPVNLNNKPATGRYLITPHYLPGSGGLARADLASAILSCVDTPGSVRQGLVVGRA